MLNITTCHLINYPTGRWGFVGHIPASLCRVIPAEPADIIAGRAYPCPCGKLITSKANTYASKKEAIQAAKLAGVEVVS